MFKSINQAFRNKGLALRPNAAKAIADFLKIQTEFGTSQSANELYKYADEIVHLLQNRGLSSNIVQLDDVEGVLSEVQSLQTAEPVDLVEVIDSFNMESVRYVPSTKSFCVYTSDSALHTHGHMKIEIFRERYLQIKQRLLRNPLLAPPPAYATKQSANYELCPLEALLGTKSRKYLFGMITEKKDGRFYLEDPTSSVELDVRNASVETGLFTENCFVLVEGKMEEDVFIVSKLAFPLTEARVTTLTDYPILAPVTPLQMEELSRIESESENDFLVLLSDVFLDKPQVMQKLEVILDSLVDNPPLMFVFMGNFTSQSFSTTGQDMKQLQGFFNTLSATIASRRTLAENCDFLFMPGPKDASFGHILPSPPLPDYLANRLKQRLPRAHLVSNPCRVRVFTKEIVFFRDDLLHKVRRNCIVTPSYHETNDMSIHLVRTVLSQGHLSPVPLTIQPIYWAYDHAMRLYPLPDLLVLGDNVSQFRSTESDCTCINPGSFSGDFSFVLLKASDIANPEFSRVPDT